MIVFDDMLGNEKLQQIVTKLFIRRRKLNISIVFITRSYFAVPYYTRLIYCENSEWTRASTNRI